MRIWDISVAFFHADIGSVEPIAVIPPAGLRMDPRHYWQLLKAMYGTRRASQLFQEYLARIFEENGLDLILLPACRSATHDIARNYESNFAECSRLYLFT